MLAALTEFQRDPLGVRTEKFRSGLSCTERHGHRGVGALQRASPYLQLRRENTCNASFLMILFSAARMGARGRDASPDEGSERMHHLRPRWNHEKKRTKNISSIDWEFAIVVDSTF